MAKLIDRLNAAAIEAATRPGYYADGGGLYLQVSKGGSKSWIFRYSFRGRAHEKGVGSLASFSLAEARKRARMHRQQLADGIDPLEAERAQRAQEAAQRARAITFKEAAEAFIANNRPGWSERSYEQWKNSLARHAYPVIGEIAVQDVDTGMLVNLLKPIWTTKTETAKRVRNRIERILDSCTTLEQRSGPNPARWTGHLKNVLPAPSKVAPVQHHPALPWRDIPDFVTKLGKRTGDAARALEMTILCAVRTAGTIGLPWKELDFAINAWNLPKWRNKGRDLCVPLVPRVLAILEAQQQGSPDDFVFRYEGEPLSENAMLAVLDRMGYGHVTTHGFRSTFKDWATENRHEENIVTAMALGHAIGNQTEEAYRRGDLFERRRQLMLKWANYCNPTAHSATIVEMRHSSASAAVVAGKGIGGVGAYQQNGDRG